MLSREVVREAIKSKLGSICISIDYHLGINALVISLRIL